MVMKERKVILREKGRSVSLKTQQADRQTNEEREGEGNTGKMKRRKQIRKV